jgi:hypothetical protein
LSTATRPCTRWPAAPSASFHHSLDARRAANHFLLVTSNVRHPHRQRRRAEPVCQRL